MFTRCWNWLVVEWRWPAAAVFAGGMLLPFVAVVWHLAGPVLGLVALQLPLYMLHQGEEHLGDRFRHDVNAMFGAEVLSRGATFWINSIGVWGVDLASILLAAFVAPAWGVIAVDLAILNGVIHVLSAIKRRTSNPGLVTAIVLLIPIGALSLWRLSEDPSMTAAMQWTGVGVAVLIHLLIIAWVVRCRRTLARHAR